MGYLYIVLAALLWATLGVAGRLVLGAGVEPMELGFWRALLAGALFGAHALARRRLRVAAGDLPAVALFALFGIALFYTSYFLAVRAGGAAFAAILLYTAPAWVAIAAALWLGERIVPRTVAALALTLSGTALVALASEGAAGGVPVRPAAIGWGLVAGLAYASHYLFGKRYFALYDPSTLFLYALPAAALALLPAVRFAPKGPVTWLAIGFIALVPTYLANLVYGLGLRRLEATRAATVATLEPVAAAALAFAVWGEALRPMAYAGAALVLGGVVVMATRRAGAAVPPRAARPLTPG